MTIKSLKVIDSSSKKVFGNPQYIVKNLYPNLHTLEVDDYMDNDYCSPLNMDSNLTLPGISGNVLASEPSLTMELSSTPKRSNIVNKPRKLIFSNTCDDAFMTQIEVENVTPIKLVAHITPTQIEEIQSTSKSITPTAPNELDVWTETVNESSGFFSEEDTFCSLVSDALLNKSFTPEELKEYKQNQTLLKFLKRDLLQCQHEEEAILKDKRPLITQFQYLQKKRSDIEKGISSAENELLTINTELVQIEKTIKEKELELKSLLQPIAENLK